MKLITHNYLRCTAKACADIADSDCTAPDSPYPLKIVAETYEDEEQCSYSMDAAISMIQKLNWTALISSVRDIEIQCEGADKERLEKHLSALPDTLPDPSDVAAFDQIIDVIMMLDIITGELTCRKCNRAFRIVNGINNMLLKEDEIEEIKNDQDE